MIAGSVPDILFRAIHKWTEYGGAHTLFVNCVGAFMIFLFAWAIITYKLIIFWCKHR